TCAGEGLSLSGRLATRSSIMFPPHFHLRLRSLLPGLTGACLILTLLCLARPAQAAAPTNSSPPGATTVAAGEASQGHPPVGLAGRGKYFTGLANRRRVVQICMVAMCLGLFILLKKFTDTETVSRKKTTDR